jgi:hypothetical protein
MEAEVAQIAQIVTLHPSLGGALVEGPLGKGRILSASWIGAGRRLRSR